MSENVMKVLDVNWNRSREALRVVEDFFRFVDPQKEPALFCKKLRHQITNWVCTSSDLSVADLLSLRCVEDDFFREEMLSSEKNRSTVFAVLACNVQRVKESLRALEEYGKVLSVEWGLFFQKLRFEWYDFEKKFCRKFLTP